MNEPQKASEVREIYLRRLEEDLLGPKGGETEVIDQPPTSRYLLGILWPKLDQRAEDEEENFLESDTLIQEDAEIDIIDNPSSVFNRKRPSCAGLSFHYFSEKKHEVEIILNFAFYSEIAEDHEKFDHDLAATNEETDKRQWLRKPFHIRKKIDISKSSIINLKDEFDEGEKKNLILIINSKKFKDSDGKKIASTIKLLNKEFVNTTEASTYFQERNSKSLLQFKMSIRALNNSYFAEREIRSLAEDEDSNISKLIYRKAAEHGSGHVCSCSWSVKSKNEVTELKAEWFPKYEVAPVDAEGSNLISETIFKATKNNKISAEDLALKSKKEVLNILMSLVDGYEIWLDKEKHKLSKLKTSFLKGQAKKNIDKCKEAIHRMKGGIKFLDNSEQGFEAFQLANNAMLKQFKWTKKIESKKQNKDLDNDNLKLRWRPFQIGFALLTLEGIGNPNSDDRKLLDLLWFPTGGGKTEAYLLLIAFQIFLTRIKEGKESDYHRTEVIMRYTLRALTLQQFQRAAAVIFACNILREANIEKFGKTPFSVGLWVGDNMTPNKLFEAKRRIKNPDDPGSPKKLNYCPACGENLHWNEYLIKDNQEPSYSPNCKNSNCDLFEAILPVLTIDEHIYLEPPSLIFGTSDKFAQLARNENSGRIFDKKIPPSLIIQDELHLINGPLGSMTGLLETAIDNLCTKNNIIPKIIGSTATIRQASKQARRLFNRSSFQFPPPCIDSDNSGFAVSKDISSNEGRLYIGICTQGSTEKMVREYLSGSVLQSFNDPNIHRDNKDLYSTLVSYFGSLKILGGAFNGMQEAVKGFVTNFGSHRFEQNLRVDTNIPAELTSRVSSTKLDEILNDLSLPYTNPNYYETVLATNMISVGVDIPRLGLMSVNGQPKSMTEYIQATSRVGRSNPGLVLTLYNSARVRDKSHYESFQTWHSALYKSVEATTSSPFSPRAIQKAIHQPLIILARHKADVGLKLKRNTSDYEEILSIKKCILERINEISPSALKEAEKELNSFIDDWIERAASDSPKLRHWWSPKEQYANTGLLIGAEYAEARKAMGRQPSKAKSTPNSVRNIDPSVIFKLGNF